MQIRATNEIGFQVNIQSDDHQLLADEPISVGGENLGPDPYELLLGSLAACKLITVRMYADRKGWPLEKTYVGLSTRKIYARDCEDCESNPDAKVDEITIEIEFEGDLDQAQRERLKEISERCPVHRTLISETKIRTTLLKTDS